MSAKVGEKDLAFVSYRTNSPFFHLYNTFKETYSPIIEEAFKNLEKSQKSDFKYILKFTEKEYKKTKIGTIIINVIFDCFILVAFLIGSIFLSKIKLGSFDKLKVFLLMLAFSMVILPVQFVLNVLLLTNLSSKKKSRDKKLKIEYILIENMIDSVKIEKIKNLFVKNQKKSSK